jgi:hypothetical protein
MRTNISTVAQLLNCPFQQTVSNLLSTSNGPLFPKTSYELFYDKAGQEFNSYTVQNLLKLHVCYIEAINPNDAQWMNGV